MPAIELIDMLAEDSGHLLINDSFLASIFEKMSSQLTVRSSPESVEAMSGHHGRTTRLRVLPFHSRWARRLPLRLRTILRILAVPRHSPKTYILQSFEELSALAFATITKRSRIILIVTNNLGGLESTHKRMKKWALGRLFTRVDAIVVHSDFEMQTIKKLFPWVPPGKVSKVRFHQFGIARPGLSFAQRERTISYIGGGRPDQGLDVFLHWAGQRYLDPVDYRLASNIDPVRVRQSLLDKTYFAFFPGFMEHKDYLKMLSSSLYIMLPYSLEYAGKTSGIFADAVTTTTPVIGPRIEPFVSMFKYYGDMGFLLDFAQPPPPDMQRGFLNPVRYALFQENMRKACRDHGQRGILVDYLRAISGNHR